MGQIVGRFCETQARLAAVPALWLKSGVNEILSGESTGQIDRSHRNDGCGEIVCGALPAAKDKARAARYRRHCCLTFWNADL